MASNVPPVLNTGEGGAPPAAPARYTRCDFCECDLTANGTVFRVSETAKGFRDQKEKYEKEIAALNEKLDAQRAEIAAQARRIEELTGTGNSPTPQSNRNRVGVL